MKNITKPLLSSLALTLFAFNASATEVTDIAEFNEQLNQFSIAHDGLAPAITSVQEHVQYYEDALNDQHRDESIKMHGLRGFWGTQLSEVEGSLNGWIQANGYKNFPSIADHGQAIVDFSTRHEPVVQQVRGLIRNSQQLEGDMYGQISTAVEYTPFLRNIRLSMIVINHVRPMIAALPNFEEGEAPAAPALTAPTPLELFLETDGFDLAVLNKSLEISRRAVNPLNPMLEGQFEGSVEAVIASIDLPEDFEGDRESEGVQQKVREIIQDNFGM